MRCSLARCPALALAAFACSACVDLAVPEPEPEPCPAGQRPDPAGACVATCATPLPWYRDRDGDGHGSGEVVGEACELPAEGARDALDCVDERPATGEEADTRILSEAFVDADQDGAGDPGRPALGCDPLPPGLSRSGDDCDDAAAMVHPDRCGECVGPALEACGTSGSCASCRADLVLRGFADDRLGDVAVADFDGDGQDDLAVGGPDHLGYVGVVHVVFGPLGEGEGPLDGPLSVQLLAPGDHAGVGYSLAALDDLDGDGAAELLVGTASFGTEPHHAGTASLVPGRVFARARAEGLPRQLPLLGEAGVAALVLRENPLDQNPVILRVAAAADLTGDGRPDLVVAGEGGADRAAPAIGRVGAAFVVPADCFASAGSPAAEVDLTATPSCAAAAGPLQGASFYGEAPLTDGRFVTARPADLDGVPPLDLVVLLPAPPGGIELVGLFGPVLGRHSTSTAGAFTVRPVPGGIVRAAAVLPDLDGDGFAELALSDNSSAPRLDVIYGPFAAGMLDLAAPGAVRVVTRVGTPSGTFGENVSSAGDLDGDGVAELLVTDLEFVTTGRTEGSVLIYRGASLLPGAAAEEPVRLEGPVEDFAALGRNAAAAGDLNGDGFRDVVVTARMENSLNGGTLPGAYVFDGPGQVGPAASPRRRRTSKGSRRAGPIARPLQPVLSLSP